MRYVFLGGVDQGRLTLAEMTTAGLLGCQFRFVLIFAGIILEAGSAPSKCDFFSTYTDAGYFQK